MIIFSYLSHIILNNKAMFCRVWKTHVSFSCCFCWHKLVSPLGLCWDGHRLWSPFLPGELICTLGENESSVFFLVPMQKSWLVNSSESNFFTCKMKLILLYSEYCKQDVKIAFIDYKSQYKLPLESWTLRFGEILQVAHCWYTHSFS